MKILARVACLGLFTFKYLSIDTSEVNNRQKNRIDYSLQSHLFPKKELF